MIWRLALSAVITAIAALIVRQVKPEFAMFVQLGGVLMAALLVMSALREVLAAVESMLGFAPNLGGAGGGSGGSFSMLAKALGICITTQLAADICRDSGSASLANAVELGGRLLILALTLPLLKSIAEMAVGLIRG